MHSLVVTLYTLHGGPLDIVSGVFFAGFRPFWPVFALMIDPAPYVFRLPDKQGHDCCSGDRRNIIHCRFSYISGWRNNSQLGIYPVIVRISPANLNKATEAAFNVKLALSVAVTSKYLQLLIIIGKTSNTYFHGHLLWFATKYKHKTHAILIIWRSESTMLCVDLPEIRKQLTSTQTLPFHGQFVFSRLGLVTINLCTKFEIYTFTQYKDMKNDE